MVYIWVTLIIGVLALLIAWYYSQSVQKEETGTDKMKEIADAIHDGAMAFLKTEYKVTAWFIVAMSVVIFLFLFLVMRFAQQ